MLAKMADMLVLEGVDDGAGGGLMAEAPHSCHENGRTGSLIRGEGGGMFV